MNTSHLPYIIAIAAAGGLSPASRQLGISQPALTKHLKKLEEETGMELFFHNQKKYIPTPAGRLYLKTAQDILEQMRHTRSAIAALGGTGLPPLRLGVSPNRGVALMTQFYPSFDKRYPQQPISLREGYANDLKELLLQNKLDFVISTHAGIQPDGLNILRIREEELVLAVPAFHPAVHHRTFVMEDLPYADLHAFQDSVFIMPDTASTLNTLIQTVFTEAHFWPQLAVSSPNIVLQEALVRGGTRVAVLPAFYVHPNEEIAYFRIRTSARMVLSCITREGHVFTEPERYILYLLIKQHIYEGKDDLLCRDLMREILREFDPLEAARQQMEG